MVPKLVKRQVELEKEGKLSLRNNHPQAGRIWYFKDVLAVAFLAAVCFVAIWQRLETLAIATLVGMGVIAYKRTIRKIIDAGYEFVAKTRNAKIGQVELTVQEPKDYSRFLDQKAQWVQLVSSELTDRQISLLLSINSTGKYRIPNKMKDDARALRARGLLEHNAPTMLESNQVWLTKFGAELASALRENRDSSGRSKDKK